MRPLRGLQETRVATREESGVLGFPSRRGLTPRGSLECNPVQLHSSQMLAKQCSKFSMPGFNSMWTMNFQMFKLYLEKAEEPEMKLPTSVGSWKKQESSRKTSTSAFLTMPKPLTVWITKNENSSRDENTRLPYLPPEKPVCRSRSNRQNQTWNNQLLPNWERTTLRLYFVTLLIQLLCRLHHAKCQTG